jgi:hypothetical protein
LAASGPFSFQLTPEGNVGFASTSVSDPVDASAGGFHLDVGMRAGAEIHFGFIDIPQLSLQASIGAGMILESTNSTTETPAGDNEFTTSSLRFATSVQNSPWYIFTSQAITAFYYF